ncbi:hypothetical protein P3102_30060 [Amycolatopsis sp. QT-25]|uniref:hypothetical protein n=1 Tax=Amycolatopsis sp. QT-25 TaxID=3034022 RepID=UPI0023ED982F|nr:hypothetical protein [Amycolatopsis sp. QT-25]WET78274.1 hypothetical protein P3102_30060 [Amycolatopsis sp. QT-25]
MNPPLTPQDLRSALEALDHVFEAFTEEIGEEPTLGEFLEIMSLAIEPDEDVLPGAPVPLLMKAKKKNGRWYEAELSDSVASLNDNTFAEAGAFLTLLMDRHTADGTPTMSTEELANGVLEVLQASERAFADIAAEDIHALTLPKVKKSFRSKTGDVFAIPAEPQGYHLAVVIGNDRMGLAIGLLEGVFSRPEVGEVGRHRARHIPIHTGTRLIKDGTWQIIGNHPSLLELFPDPPDLYWNAVTVSGRRFGEYGGAGPIEGPFRLIGKAEAEAVGLLDETYRSSYTEEYLQKQLNEGRFDNGPAPRSWL